MRFAYGEAPIDDDQSDARLLSELSALERELYVSLQSTRRRAEFLAGRIAVRRAIAIALGQANLGDLVVARHPDGAPKLEGISHALAISISHGRARAVAAAVRGNDRIGIDLCDHADAPRIRRVAARAFPREAERALALRDDLCALTAWAIKEAVGKALRIGLLYDAGFERIELLSLEPPRVRVTNELRAIELTTRGSADGMEAIATVSPLRVSRSAPDIA